MQVSLFELVSHCYTARLYQVSSKTWFWGKFYWYLRLQYSCQNQFVAEKMVALIRIPTLQYCWSPRVLDVGKERSPPFHVLLISPQDYQVFFGKPWRWRILYHLISYETTQQIQMCFFRIWTMVTLVVNWWGKPRMTGMRWWDWKRLVMSSWFKLYLTKRSRFFLKIGQRGHKKLVDSLIISGIL